MTGISLRTIQRIENGEVSPRPFTIRQIESTLGTTRESSTSVASIGEHEFLLKCIFTLSLCLPILYPMVAWVYWKQKIRQPSLLSEKVKRVIYLNIITGCIAMPLVVLISAMFLRSLGAPVAIRFIPIVVPIYWFYASINLWWTWHHLGMMESEHEPTS